VPEETTHDGDTATDEPGHRPIDEHESHDERTITTEEPDRGPGNDEARERMVSRPGRPFNRSNPLVLGFMGAVGVFLAYTVAQTISSIRSTLVLVFVALFLAVGLEPLVAFLTRRRVPRSLAVLAVVLAAVGVVAAFVYAAISPIQHEVNQLSVSVPKWRDQIATGKGELGRLATEFHLNSYFKSNGTNGSSKLTTTVESGAIGAGKIVLSAVSSFLIVTVLTVYFLASLPSIKRFFVRLIPNTRRPRFAMLLDEVLSRVGGYVLGNLFTSLVAGLGTYIWAMALGIPYAILLSLLVAIFDLIPVVGSTVAGVIVALVALAVSVPVAIATAIFYALYRVLEDYLLVPRVMRHTVDVSPVVTVLATLIGGAALGIVGALVAIPVAAAIKLLLEESAFPRLDRS
jgi:predicted PurR-regulated permease PerM